MASEAYTAPTLATAGEAARELGVSKASLYRMVKLGQMPRVHTGQRAMRIPMPAARKMFAGEAIDPALLANPEVRSCAICAWSGTTSDLKRNAAGEISCPICGSTQVRVGIFEE